MEKEGNDWTREELQREYIEKMTAVTVPVNITTHGQRTILDLSTVEKLLRDAQIITIEDCGCRTKWHKCDAPIDARALTPKHAIPLSKVPEESRWLRLLLLFSVHIALAWFIWLSPSVEKLNQKSSVAAVHVVAIR